MEDLIVIPEIWVGVIAALIPLLTSLVVKGESSTRRRALVAAAAVVLLAVVEQVTANAFTIEGLISTGAIAMITQVTAYVAIWKPVVDVNARALPSVGV